MKLFAPPLLMFNASAKLVALFVGCLLFSVRADAGQATLAWDPSASPAAAGYMVYYGPSSGTYSGKADAGKQTTYTVTALRDGQTYFYAVTAYDSGRAESAFSNEASATVAGSAPVATPVAAQAAGGGGGGGCAIGVSEKFDPTLPVLLFTAGLFFLSRQKFHNSASTHSYFLRACGRNTKTNNKTAS